jgi:hypothetical protein
VVDLCRDQAGNAVQRGGAHADNWVWQAAQQGHACAQHFLGCLHLIGLVVEHDVVAAETWLEKAAEQDFTPAQLSLGSLNFRKEDYEKSARWFHPAAEKGHVEAQTILGFLHFGRLARRDYDESYKWYRRAADQGFSEAQSALAGCYEFGWGVQEDSSAAHSWYQKAADQGDSRAQFRLGRAYEQGKWGGDCQQAARLLLQSCLSPGGQTIDASDLGFDKLIKFVPTLFRECNAFSQVKTLNLALAEIDNEGVLAIVQLIQENQVIEVLDLENNWFDSTGLDAIAHALHANLVLKKLVVGNGGFRQSIRADIKLSLKKNSNIAALKKAAHANPIKGSKDLPTELIPLIENFLIEIDQKPIGVQQTRKQTQSRLNALRQSVYYGSSIRPSE